MRQGQGCIPSVSGPREALPRVAQYGLVQECTFNYAGIPYMICKVLFLTSGQLRVPDPRGPSTVPNVFKCLVPKNISYMDFDMDPLGTALEPFYLRKLCDRSLSGLYCHRMPQCGSHDFFAYLSDLDMTEQHFNLCFWYTHAGHLNCSPGPSHQIWSDYC